VRYASSNYYMTQLFRKITIFFLLVVCLMISAGCVTSQNPGVVTLKTPSNLSIDYRCKGVIAGGWQERMDQNSMVMPDGSIVLTGGNNAIQFADVWRSSDEGATWSLVNPCADWVNISPYQFEGWNGVMSDGSIIFFGYDFWNTTNIHGTVWKSTDNGATWNQVNPNGEWFKREPIGIITMPDNSIIILGSDESTGNPDPKHATIFYNDVWRSTDLGLTWKELTADAGWSPRYGQSSVVLPDGSIVMMGGEDDKFGERNDTWRSTDGGATWILMNESSGWPPRWETSSVVLPDGSIVLMGGHGKSSALFNDVWRSTDKGATWSLMNASAGWHGRWGHSSVALPDGNIVLMGGYTPNVGRLKDVWRSTDKGTTWELVNASA
jgi:photosystem II stability/assembly factor-like uncharacterized protein